MLEELMEEKRNEYVIIEGNFNIRIGEETLIWTNLEVK